MQPLLHPSGYKGLFKKNNKGYIKYNSTARKSSCCANKKLYFSCSSDSQPSSGFRDMVTQPQPARGAAAAKLQLSG